MRKAAFCPFVSEDERDKAKVGILDAHEDFVQHIESGQTRIRTLSVITVVVAFILIASYASQLLIPFAGGSRFQTVDLLNPTLIALQVVLVILTGAWLYVGVVNYLFATRMGKQIREFRSLEREIEKKIVE
jgi:preprotein translocase subunit SecE